jgi:Flp pilus assembly protein TadG
VKRHRAGSDDGTVMILMIFFALIVAAVITAVVDVSTVFLAQRQLQSTADGAALVAAQQADTAAIYTGNLGSTVPLVPEQVRNAAMGYAVDPIRVPHNCSATSYRVSEAAVGGDGQTVTVTLTCRVPLPFVGAIASLWSDGVLIAETANAQAAVTPIE